MQTIPEQYKELRVGTYERFRYSGTRLEAVVDLMSTRSALDGCFIEDAARYDYRLRVDRPFHDLSIGRRSDDL